MNYDDEYASSEGLYNTNLYAIKLYINIFTNSVSGPFLKCQVNYKIFDDYDCD